MKKSAIAPTAAAPTASANWQAEIWQRAEAAFHQKPAIAVKIAAELAELGARAEKISVEARLAAGQVLAELRDRTDYGKMLKAWEREGYTRQRASEMIAVWERFGADDGISAAVAIGWTKCLQCAALEVTECAALAQGQEVRGVTVKKMTDMSTRQLQLAFMEESVPLAEDNKKLFNRYQNAQREVRELKAKLEASARPGGLGPAQQLPVDGQKGIGFIDQGMALIENAIDDAIAISPEVAAEVAAALDKQIKDIVYNVNQRLGKARAALTRAAELAE